VPSRSCWQIIADTSNDAKPVIIPLSCYQIIEYSEGHATCMGMPFASVVRRSQSKIANQKFQIT
jgi:hypothetical protein